MINFEWNVQPIYKKINHNKPETTFLKIKKQQFLQWRTVQAASSVDSVLHCSARIPAYEIDYSKC